MVVVELLHFKRNIKYLAEQNCYEKLERNLFQNLYYYYYYTLYLQ